MRTTLTLDDDVAAMLKRLRNKSTKSFKEIVNQVLREGLKQSLNGNPHKPFKTRVHDGGKLLIDPHQKIEDILDEIEGPWRR